MRVALYPKYLIRSLFVHGKRHFFKAGYQLLYPECSRNGLTPWQHYVMDGKRKGYDNGNHPSDKMFFREGYQVEYPDVANSKADPWHHYVQYGKKEGRDNGLHPEESRFFPEGYLEMYPDVAESKIDPWRHYVRYGKKEGRDNGLHPDQGRFCEKGYLALYPDVAKSGIDPWKHYVLYGKSEGRNNGLSGFALIFSGHENDVVKSVYLAQHKLNRPSKLPPKKVLLIGDRFSYSDDSLRLMDIARLLISRGYSVDIAVSGSSSAEALHVYDGLGADVFMLPETSECFSLAERVVRNYGLVIVNTIFMGAYAELCRQLSVPHIWFIREDSAAIHRYFQTIEGSKQRFIADCENIVCVSKYASDQLFENYRITCKYINNFVFDGFSAENSQNCKNNGQIAGRVTTFAVVGDVRNFNTQESVVAAFLYISFSPKYKDSWKLLIIGKHGKNSPEPDLGLRLESVTKNVPNILWCDEIQKNRKDVLESIDFLIVPSLDEPSSSVAIEAAMLGKPVIVTTRVGAKYLVENNAGYSFEPGNKAELRDVIIKCLDMTDDEYRNMSRNIRHNYEKTSSPSVYLDALSSVINDASKRCAALHMPIETIQSITTTLRTLGPGANVTSSKRLEYFRFIDFGNLDRLSANTPVKNVSVIQRGSKVGVVVPVYNGVEHLKVLIPSLFKNTDLPHKFVFVDDCSQKETADFLARSVRGRDDCILITNEINLGFVKSVNRGASKALECCGNFVMLNSDTEVPSGWLSRLMQPIFEDEKVASVTPLSNRCTLFSFPYFDNEQKNDAFLKEFGLEGINKAIRNSCIDRQIDIYSGHGFCMAISGKAWMKIGGLNSVLFGRGYGEENEWSFRSELDGFKNVFIPTLYVAHHEKGSFSREEREKNCAAAREILNVMYPSSMHKVSDFMMEYPLSDSIVSIFLTLAKMRGYKAEVCTDKYRFMRRISGGDGIVVLKGEHLNTLAVKLLGEVMYVENAKNLENTGIFTKDCIKS